MYRNSIAPIAIALVFLAIAGSVVAQSPQPCSEFYYSKVGTTYPNRGHKKHHSLGETPSQDDRDAVASAISKIGEWEDLCASLGNPLPGLPSSNPTIGSGTVKVSDALEGVDFCVETNPNMQPGASTNPPPDGTPYPADDGGFHWSEGPQLVLNNDYLDAAHEYPDTGGCELLATTLIHEAFHLENDPDPNDSEHDMEVGAYQWQMEYLCHLVDCLVADGQGAVATNICDIMELLIVKIHGAPYCISITPACTHCPPLSSLMPGWNAAALPAMTGTSQSVVFSPGIGGGPGNFTLDPITKKAEAVSLSLGSSGLKRIPIDFSTQLPGFQPTSFDLIQKRHVQSIGVAGYNELTGSGMLVQVDLDFAAPGSFALTTRYIGSGFGIPLDVFAFAGAANRVFILDHTAKIVLVKIVSGVSSTLADATSAPSLTDCRYLTGGPITEIATGTVTGIQILASERETTLSLGGFSSDGEYVQLLDVGNDGTIDEIID